MKSDVSVFLEFIGYCGFRPINLVNEKKQIKTNTKTKTKKSYTTAPQYNGYNCQITTKKANIQMGQQQKKT